MQIQHLIDGAAVASAEYFETVNPATQEVLAEVARGGEREVDAAVCRRQGGVSRLGGQARRRAGGAACAGSAI